MKNMIKSFMIMFVAALVISACGSEGSDSDAPVKQWTEAASAPFAYHRFDAEYSYATNKVYFLGGRTGTGETDGSIWEFDPATGAYTDIGVDIPNPVSNYNIARLTDGSGNEVLVTFGGRLGNGVYTDAVQGS